MRNNLCLSKLLFGKEMQQVFSTHTELTFPPNLKTCRTLTKSREFLEAVRQKGAEDYLTDISTTNIKPSFIPQLFSLSRTVWGRLI